MGAVAGGRGATATGAADPVLVTGSYDINKLSFDSLPSLMKLHLKRGWQAVLYQLDYFFYFGLPLIFLCPELLYVWQEILDHLQPRLSGLWFLSKGK